MEYHQIWPFNIHIKFYIFTKFLNNFISELHYMQKYVFKKLKLKYCINVFIDLSIMQYMKNAVTHTIPVQLLTKSGTVPSTCRSVNNSCTRYTALVARATDKAPKPWKELFQLLERLEPWESLGLATPSGVLVDLGLLGSLLSRTVEGVSARMFCKPFINSQPAIRFRFWAVYKQSNNQSTHVLP